LAKEESYVTRIQITICRAGIKHVRGAAKIVAVGLYPLFIARHLPSFKHKRTSYPRYHLFFPQSCRDGSSTQQVRHCCPGRGYQQENAGKLICSDTQAKPEHYPIALQPLRQNAEKAGSYHSSGPGIVERGRPQKGSEKEYI
jgi:hypothetical protein